MPLTLRIHHPKTGGLEERTFDTSEVSIGRDPSNHLVLADAERAVSRRHATIKLAGRPMLFDLGSHNSTSLNDQPLQSHIAYELAPGDVIKVGSFRIDVERMDSAATNGRATDDDDTRSSGRLSPAFEPLPLTPDGPYTRFFGSNAPAGGHAAPNAALERAVRELSFLNELAVEIGTAGDTETAVRLIVQRAVRGVQAEQGTVTLAPNKAQRAGGTMIRTMGGDVEAVHSNPFLLSWMETHQKPLLLNNPHADAAFAAANWPASVRSVLSVPLIVRSTMVGVLTLYNKQHPAGFTWEDLRLLIVIASQSAQAIENTRLQEEERRYLQVQQDLRVALEIQVHLLPKHPPRVAGYDIVGHSVPARTVGGDYFDYIRLKDGRLALCLGDVAGKGLPAALVMASLQATLRAQTYWCTDVGACINGANDLLFDSTNKRTFITLFYGILDPVRHHFTFANAGHNKPFLLRQGQPPVQLTSGGLALALKEGMECVEDEVGFGPGDLLFIYSDGVTEAMSPDRAEFGERRLAGILDRHRRQSSGYIIDRVLERIRDHVGTADPSDDITMLVIRRNEDGLSNEAAAAG